MTENVDSLISKMGRDLEALKQAVRSGSTPGSAAAPRYINLRAPTVNTNNNQNTSQQSPLPVSTPLASYGAAPKFLANSFRRKSSTFSGPAKKAKVNSPFLVKRIIVLDSADKCKVLNQSEITAHRKVGLVKDFIHFSKELSSLEVTSKIGREFPILSGSSFHFLKVEDKALVEPTLEHDTAFDGEIIHGLAYRATLYIRPSTNLNLIKGPAFSNESSSDEEANKEAIDDFAVMDCNESFLSGESDSCDLRDTVLDFQAEVEVATTSHVEPPRNESEPTQTRSTSVLVTETPSTSVSVTETPSTSVSVIETLSTSVSVETDQQLQKYVLSGLRSQLNSICIDMEVNRPSILDDIMAEMRRSSFNPAGIINVTFTDTVGVEKENQTLETNFIEEAHDLGGPTRELFTLGFRELRDSQLFCGDESGKHLRFNANSSYSPDDSDNDYTLAGRFIAMSFLHGGPGPNFLSEELYANIIQGDIFSPSVESAGDMHIRTAILKIKNANSLADLRSAILDEALDEAGIKSYATSLGQKETIFKQAVHYFAKIKIRPALEDFCRGLETCGFLDVLRRNPLLFKEYFIPQPVPLTRKELLKLFVFKRSLKGTREFQLESQTISYFFRFLKDCEDGSATSEEILESVAIADVLFFATGCDRIPPGGFSTTPTILFEHEDSDDNEGRKKKYPKNLPKANTCVITVYLPVVHTSYDTFKKFMVLGLSPVNRGFGFC